MEYYTVVYIYIYIVIYIYTIIYKYQYIILIYIYKKHMIIYCIQYLTYSIWYTIRYDSRLPDACWDDPPYIHQPQFSGQKHLSALRMGSPTLTQACSGLLAADVNGKASRCWESSVSCEWFFLVADNCWCSSAINRFGTFSGPKIVGHQNPNVLEHHLPHHCKMAQAYPQFLGKSKWKMICPQNQPLCRVSKTSNVSSQPQQAKLCFAPWVR